MGKRGPKPGHGVAGPGRPPIDPESKIDSTMVEVVEKMASIQCTQEEISAFIGISLKSFHNHKPLLHAYKKGIDRGKSSLRRIQWKQAEEGSTAMAIFLGKNYLKQSDKIIHSGDDDNPINNVMTIRYVDAEND